MKMNYHLGSKNRKSRDGTKKIVIIGLLIAVVTFVLLFVFSSSLFSFGKLVWSSEESAGNWFGNFFLTVQSKQELLSKIEELENERNMLKLELLEMQSASLALGAYVRDVGIYSSTSTKMVGKIVRRPPDSPYDTLVLDIGSSDGVETGMHLTWSNTRVGVVSEVMNDFSIARLYSSPKEKFKVIVGESSFEATAEGMGGGYFVIEVPRDIEVSENDIVRDLTRKSMLFGVVYKVEIPESGTMKKAFVKLPFPIFDAEWVTLTEENYVE